MWRGPVRWSLTGHRFTSGKREKAISGGIHSGDAIGASVVKSVAGGGCYNVEELVLAGGEMSSTVMMGRLMVVLDG